MIGLGTDGNLVKNEKKRPNIKGRGSIGKETLDLLDVSIL